MSGPYFALGKEVLANGEHYADACDPIAAAHIAASLQRSGWQDIASAPRDGTEFACGWFFNGRFVRDLGKFYQAPSWDRPKLIQARYRHRLDATHWCALPDAPTTPSTEGQGA